MDAEGPDGVLERLHAGQLAASFGAALELGLLGVIDERPMRADEVARRLDIPPGRCERWLETLRAARIVECSRAGYAPAAWIRAAILDTYSGDTWAFLALEAREAMAGLVDLPSRLRSPGPGADNQADDTLPAGTPPLAPYVRLMNADPGRARRFTRMLCELHASLAIRIARALPLGGVDRLLDVGGGSGVVSMSLARRHPDIAITVVDIPNVCAAGREIVGENGLAGRIAFVPVNLASDALPAGFDAAIECDVGVYDVALFERVRAALRPGGRFFVVDELAADAAARLPHLDWAFARSLDDPGFVPATVARVVTDLREAGFTSVAARSLPPLPGVTEAPAAEMSVITARS